MDTFVETANGFGQWLVVHLRQMSIELTILAGVVLAVLYLLRIRSPALRHAFWCLVLAKPVATFLLASPLSLYWFLRPPPAPVVRQAEPPAVVEYDARPVQWSERAMYPHRQPIAAPMPPRPPAWQQLDRHGAVALGWVVVAVGLGLRLVIGSAYVRFLRRTSTPRPTGPLAELVAEAAKTFRIRRRVAVATSDVPHGPVLAGVLRPVILLPNRLVALLSTDQMKLIIAHELAHVRRRDNLLLVIQRLAEMLFFFHPVVWFCGWVMRREAEAACDDAVVRAFGGSTAYADSLTRVAEMKCGITRRLLVNTFAAAESNFSQRVRRILDERVGRMRFGLSVAGVVALVAIACVGLPTAAARKAKLEAPDKETAMQGERTKAPPDAKDAGGQKVASNKTNQRSANVKRDGKKVRLAGVPTLGWGQGKECTFAGALESALAVTEHPYKYADIMGLTALAFRVRWFQGHTGQRWCPSSPVGEFPEEMEAIQKATGWRFRLENLLGQAHPQVERFAPDIKSAIDAGRPVLAYGTKLNVATVYGYEAGGKVFLLRDYVNGEPPLKLDASKIGPMLIFLREHARPMDPRGALIEVLSTAVRNWRREPMPSEKGKYWYGDAALAAWIKDLGQADKLQQKDRENLFFVSLWNYNCLFDARKTACVFLKESAKLFKEEGAEALERAAAQYEKQDKLFGAVFGTKDAFFGPWSGKSIKDWSAAVRKREQEVLAEAREIETIAIAEIEKALTAEGIEVQHVAGKPYPKSAMLENVPGGKAHYDAFVGGLTIALSHSGIPTDYDTLVGDLGTAFILQASDQVPKYGGALDAGWWPLAWDCLPVLFERVAPALGVRVEWVGGNYDEYKADPAAYYRDRLAGTVKASITSGRPVLENHGFWEVVVGYDGEEPPLLSFCPRSGDGKQSIKRLEKHPIVVAALGSAVSRLDRKTADLEALKRAVALGRDQIPMPNGYRTGQRAFALWADTLRDTEHLGQARWHANVVGHLGRYRRCAITYLRAMAERHSEKTASHLKAAADLYESGLAELKKADTSDNALVKSTRGREALARLAEHIATLELKAIIEMEQALRAEGIDVEVPKMAVGTSGQSVARGKRLPGLEQKRSWVTHMGCLIGCAEYLKIDAPPAWIWGASGHAFALNIHEAICPSGPTAWAAEKCDRLAANAGVSVEDLRADKRHDGFARKQEEIWRKTRRAIDAGLPCFGWELGVPDWYVITGYDADGHYLFTEFNETPARKHYTELGDSEIGVACVLIVKPGKVADDRTAVREALVFALDHAAGKDSHEIWHAGLDGYDTWIKALQDNKLVNDSKAIGLGQAYNAQCWAECRRQAVGFLQEAKKRLSDEKLAPQLDEAVGHYKTVSKNLETVARAFPFDVDDKKGMDKRVKDASRRAKAVQALTAARDAERSGLKALAHIAVALGAKRINPDDVGAMAAAPDDRKHSQVVLENAVKAFKDAQKAASHGNVAQPAEVYPQPSAYLYTHYICMRAAGWDDVDFDTLAAVSGSSALFAYDPTTLMPKYANLHIGMDQRIADATGFGFEWLRFGSEEEAWQLIKQTIDSGRPAKAHYWEDMLFVGYQDAGRKEDRKAYVMGDPFPGPGVWWTWTQFGEWVDDYCKKFKQCELGRHTKRVRKVAAKAVALRVLQDAVAWSTTPPAAVKNASPKARFGLAGIEAYANDVADVDGKPKAYFKEPAWLGCHAINPQWTARNSTGVYLERLAGTKTFGKKVNAHLVAASKTYKVAYTAWQAFYQQLGHAAPKNAWSTKNRRLAGAAAVRDALEHEKAAIDHLRRALAAAGIADAVASSS